MISPKNSSKETIKLALLLPCLTLSLCANTSWASVTSSYSEGSISNTMGNSTPHNNSITYTNKVIDTNSLELETVTFSSTPAPYILVSAKAYNRYGETMAQADGTMSYSIDISGPASTWIPVGFGGRYWLFGQDLAAQTIDEVQTASKVGFSVGGETGFSYDCGNHLCTSNTRHTGRSDIWLNETLISYDSFAGTFGGVTEILTDASGHATQMVYMDALSRSHAFGSILTFYAGAFIDPEFYIDPTWLALNPGATLSLPLGVGNAITPAAVPVPAALWLLGSGLLGLTSLTHKRKELLCSQKRCL